MNLKTKRWLKFSIVTFLIVLWIILLFCVNPENIIESLGVHNIYIVVFLLAVFAGGSSFTAPSMYGILITFVLSGTPLIPVAVIASIGSTLGDSAYMFFGKKSHKVLSSKTQKKLQKLITKIETKPKIVMPFFIFAYAAFAPIPNDLMTVSLGMAGYKIRNALIPIILGNMIYFFILLSIGTLTSARLL